MKRFFINDFIEFNKTVTDEFQSDPRNIHELILVDDLKEIYYYYNHNAMLLNDSKIKDKYYDIKGSMIPKLKNDLNLIDEIKFDQILNLKCSYVRGYFKNNFLKEFNLEEFII
jgi:RecA-family ATPase